MFRGQATPVTLTFGKGEWCLEVEVLEQASPVMFKPVRYKVEGPDQILDALHQIGATPKIVDATSRIFKDYGDAAAADLELEPAQERWVLVPTLQKRREQRPQRSVEARDLTARKQALRRILDRMSDADRSTAQGALLGRRVADLESQLREIRLSRPLGSMPPASAVLAASLRVTSFADAPPPRDDAEAELEAYDRAEPPRLRALPSVSEIQRELELLLGPSIRVTEAEAEAPEPIRFAALIIGDGGETLGAILADLRGAVVLGGALLMDSEDSVAAQIAAGEPAQEVLDALAEVCNTVVDAVAAAGENPGARVERAAPLDARELPWLDSPALSLEMDLGGGGRLLIVAR
jgi:hypothetical protein